MSASFKIPLKVLRGDIASCDIELYPVRDAYYACIDAAEAKANGEVPWQILEGCEYEYTLPEGLRFHSHPAVSQSARKGCEGRIRPGNYVGRLALSVLNEHDVEVGIVELESTSVKMDYRTDYQTMLNDLAEKSAELLMSSDEYVFQHFEIDPFADAETLYQQFAFVKSLIISDAFDASVARVCASPMKAMCTVSEVRSPMSACRLGRDAVRQFISATNRMELSSGHYIARHFGLSSIPHEIECDVREETVDVPENRFVKFVLESFMIFLRDISRLGNASEMLRDEAESLAEKLDCRLGDPLFRSVSPLDRMPLASPALQRKEGYREILRAWLMFESAAKLVWEGGEDVYSGGKRNVAVLYEYWAFFKLLDIVQSVFEMEKKDLSQLIAKDKNRLELFLRQGRSMEFHGKYKPNDEYRPLNVLFTYNKTFGYIDNNEQQGSWTVDMRPDYTLSIWPGGAGRIENAEIFESVVHVHFDAKYKIEHYIEMLGNSAANLNKDVAKSEMDEIKREEAQGVYKRGDILKMHAYNDAIRRTYGSYILYPGDKDDPKRRYREIIPGVGAFKLKPGKDDVCGMTAIEEFIRKIADSLQNRLTQRERTATYGWSVHRKPPIELPDAAKKIVLPKENNRGEPFDAAVEPILLGYYRPEKRAWIRKNGYNYGIGTGNGSLGITSDELKADYILLHSGSAVTDELFRIDKKHGPRLMTKQNLIDLGYGTPSHEAYLLFKLIPIKEGEPLYGIRCDISRLPQYASARLATQPITVTFEDILVHAVC